MTFDTLRVSTFTIVINGIWIWSMMIIRHQIIVSMMSIVDIHRIVDDLISVTFHWFVQVLDIRDVIIRDDFQSIVCHSGIVVSIFRMHAYWWLGAMSSIVSMVMYIIMMLLMRCYIPLIHSGYDPKIFIHIGCVHHPNVGMRPIFLQRRMRSLRIYYPHKTYRTASAVRIYSVSSSVTLKYTESSSCALPLALFFSLSSQFEELFLLHNKHVEQL